MSKKINGLKWRNGREICRIVCNELAGSGLSVVNWVDLSDKEGGDRRRSREFNLQLVFTAVRAQRDGKFTNVVQMIALRQDGRTGNLSDYACVPEHTAINEEDIASLLHNVVDEDGEPQYVPVVEIFNCEDFDEVLSEKEDGFYVSDGDDDMDIEHYNRTEWPFKEESRAEGEGESLSDWNKNASILRIKDMLESMPENAVQGVERVVEVMHG